MPRVSYLLALLCVPFVVGCEGCRQDPDAEEEQQQPQADFASRNTQAFPGDANNAVGSIKPGHWMTAAQSLKSNKQDARGDLLSRASATGSNFETGEKRTTQGLLPSLRPVVLPKGQMRRFDYRILTPLPIAGDQKQAILSNRFVSKGRSVYFEAVPQPFDVLSGEEFFFVVLTNRPERFAKFQISDWVRPYRDKNIEFTGEAANYRIVFPSTKDLLPLSETMLDWTSTAVVLWDDLPPDALTPQQLTALADWVRFGGQLIVNGADASDAIAKTSLANLLPLKPTGNIELDPDSASDLLRNWSVESDASTDKQIAVLRNQSGRVAIDGNASEDTESVSGAGNLILNRRIGFGRVVQPRFDISSAWLSDWKSYDSFINAVVLGRPRRQFVKSNEADTLSMVQQSYPDWQTAINDAAMNSRFRLASRDAILSTSLSIPDLPITGVRSPFDPLVATDSITGIGAWTDQSDLIRVAEQGLRTASGIEIPKSTLVIKSLGYYLLILVPINYLFFRIIGRLEYAWLAVPLIAIGGAVWVARAARLDIGFARSQTEIALLELQPDYERGHLTRVLAIYNSLSSSYDIDFKTADAAAAPISTLNADEDDTIFRTGFSEGPTLAGLSVASNTVRMVHAEQIVDVGGSIGLDANGRLVNQTGFDLLDVYVVEKLPDASVQIAVVGMCESGSSASVRFQSAEEINVSEEIPGASRIMLQLLGSPRSMPEDSMRVVARIETTVPGMTITPEASQRSSETIVLAHLRHTPFPTPQKDLNLIGDLRDVLTDREIEGSRTDFDE
ncbi:MAG: hypothetical protein AAGG48_07825 [Planctomycetota bacterium]